MELGIPTLMELTVFNTCEATILHMTHFTQRAPQLMKNGGQLILMCQRLISITPRRPAVTGRILACAREAGAVIRAELRLRLTTVVATARDVSIGAPNGNLFSLVSACLWELAMSGDFHIWPMRMAEELS